MKVLFRVDASLEIGTGHLMRCLTLADALRAAGAACRFVCREHPGNLVDFVRGEGYQVFVLPAARQSATPGTAAGDRAPILSHAGWLGASQEDDAASTAACLGGEIVDWLVVDHYALDRRWEEQLRPYCRQLMVVDDLADRMHDCDLLLDQNLGRTPADYAQRVPQRSNLLLGPTYALLRPEFDQLRSRSLAGRTQQAPQRVLVSMGGVDRDNVTGRVLDALAGSDLPPGCSITVVMGRHAPWHEQVRRRADDMHLTVDVLQDVRHMGELMAESDLAVGGAGATSWERCALGLPSVLVVLAQNQRIIAQALAKIGAAFKLELPELEQGLRSLFVRKDLPQLLTAMSLVARNVADGHGTRRVADALCRKVTA